VVVVLVVVVWAVLVVLEQQTFLQAVAVAVVQTPHNQLVATAVQV
jgi:hypothetical protein